MVGGEPGEGHVGDELFGARAQGRGHEVVERVDVVGDRAAGQSGLGGHRAVGDGGGRPAGGSVELIGEDGLRGDALDEPHLVETSGTMGP